MGNKIGSQERRNLTVNQDHGGIKMDETQKLIEEMASRNATKDDIKQALAEMLLKQTENTKMSMEQLETLALTGSAEVLAERLRQLDYSYFFANALGIACRFRGLEHVKALVESGASFDYKYVDEDGNSYWRYNYSLGLLEKNAALGMSYYLDKRSKVNQTCVRIGFDDAKNQEITVNALPIEQRAEIVRYLCENSEKVGFEPGELLFYSIISKSGKITAVLKELGAKFTEDRVICLSEDGRSYQWLEFCNMMGKLGDDELVPIVSEVAAEMDGKKFHYTDSVTWANYNLYTKQGRLFRPDIFKCIVENFNQKKMNKTQFMKGAIDQGNAAGLEICAENGWLKMPKKRDEMIQYASDKGKTECTAFLLEFKNRTADIAAEREKAEKKMERELNADPNSVSELKKIWVYEKLEDGSGLVIKRYKGNKTEIEVPEKIGKDTVTVIDDYAFSPGAPRLTRTREDFMKTVTKITLPNTIKVIGNAAFYFLAKLEELNIPDCVTKIGEKAFDDCFSLVSLEIPDSVKELGAKTFAACGNLEHVKLPSGLSEIGDYMFSGCRSLKEITVPDSVTRIGIWGFRECKALEEVIIPEGVEEIAREAFANCDKLGTVVLPDSIKMIKNYRSPPETPFHGSPNVSAVVNPKSYAEKYCKRNNIPYTYEK